MENLFREAAQACVNGLSLREASKTFSIPVKKLTKFIRENCDQYSIMPPCGRLLYDAEESSLEAFILASAARGQPLGLMDIAEAAHHIVCAFPRPIKGKTLPSSHFVRNYIKHRPALSIRVPSGL